MIEKLLEIEDKLDSLLQKLTTQESQLHSMYIDYHKPYVRRIWFQHEEYRVYVHEIEACAESSEALYHPHPWKSAIRIIDGKYEMGVGHSETNKIPSTDCKLILVPGTLYEMTDPDSWHYVNPIRMPVYSLMVTGGRSGRQMPVEPKKTFNKLSHLECQNIIKVFNEYYKWDLSYKEIYKISESASK